MCVCVCIFLVEWNTYRYREFDDIRFEINRKFCAIPFENTTFKNCILLFHSFENGKITICVA